MYTDGANTQINQAADGEFWPIVLVILNLAFDQRWMLPFVLHLAYAGGRKLGKNEFASLLQYLQPALARLAKGVCIRMADGTYYAYALLIRIIQGDGPGIVVQLAGNDHACLNPCWMYVLL